MRYPYYVPRDERTRKYLERKLIWTMLWVLMAFGIVLWDFVTHTMGML